MLDLFVQAAIMCTAEKNIFDKSHFFPKNVLFWLLCEKIAKMLIFGAKNKCNFGPFDDFLNTVILVLVQA